MNPARPCQPYAQRPVEPAATGVKADVINSGGVQICMAITTEIFQRPGRGQYHHDRRQQHADGVFTFASNTTGSNNTAGGGAALIANTTAPKTPRTVLTRCMSTPRQLQYRLDTSGH